MSKSLEEADVTAHQAIIDADTKANPSEWRASIEAQLSDTQKLMGPSDSIDRELRVLVETFRSRMTIFAKLGQTFSAFLNVLPATLAVTYILSTGDPVGAAGIKVKLSGLFGLKDLYALVALPATTGLRKADRAQLETLMGPIAQTWLNHKLKTVQHLFEENMTGGILRCARENIANVDLLVNEIKKLLETCHNSNISST